MADIDGCLNVSWWALKIGLGLGPIITGIDKYFNKLADWGMYLGPVVTKVVPVSATAFMHAVGILEIMAGRIVSSGWTRIGSYIVMFWLLASPRICSQPACFTISPCVTFRLRSVRLFYRN